MAVVDFTGITRLDIPAERVLRKAAEADLTNVVVLGWDSDGDFYFASSYASSPEVLYLLEKAKVELFRIEDEMNGEAG